MLGVLLQKGDRLAIFREESIRVYSNEKGDDDMSYLRYDPHVHCRDEEQSDKATIAGTLTLAKEMGVFIIFDMPNSARPVISVKRVQERLALVPKGEEERYRLYVGLTGESDQIEEAVRCWQRFPEVIGLKLFAGRSVGDLSVTEEVDQLRIYRMLAKLGYEGVIAVHCEKESHLRPGLWDPSKPIFHTRARSSSAEIASVADQILFASQSKFKGHLHICHVSCSASVCQINYARSEMRISCGVTPHHLMWDEDMMAGEDGLIYKMNPPLRSAETVVQLRQQVLSGYVDCIETDHAPHTELEKKPPLCLSGYPSLILYKDFVTKFLPSLGLDQRAIRALTYDNILKIFGSKI